MFDFDEIMKSTNLYLAVKDMNSNYLYCNEKLAAGLNLDSPHSIIGKSDYDFFDDHFSQQYRDGDAYALKGGVFVNVLETVPLLEKTIKILATKNLLRDKIGNPIGVVLSFIDVTGLSCKINSDLLRYDTEKECYKFFIGKETVYFTKREYDVFKKILLNATSKQIANRMNLSSRTVEDYVDKIKIKLQCSSKYHIAETAIRLGIVQQNLINE